MFKMQRRATRLDNLSMGLTIALGTAFIRGSFSGRDNIRLTTARGSLLFDEEE